MPDDVDSATATTAAPDAPVRPPAAGGLDAGTYEVLRARLAEQAAELARRAEALNARRLEVVRRHRAAPARHRADPHREQLRAPRHRRRSAALHAVRLQRLHRAEAGDRGRRRLLPAPASSRDGDGVPVRRAGHGRLPGLLRDPQFARDFAELYRYYQRDPAAAAAPRRGQAAGRLPDRRAADGHPGAALAGRRRTAASPTSTTAASATTSSRRRTTSSGSRPPASDHVLGRHPHISIQDEVFVETVGGDLTVKVENNTETGEGIYSEPVDEPLQSLADADVALRPGRAADPAADPAVQGDRTGATWSSTRAPGTWSALDGIGQACQRLPEDQGIIFPGGYYLATGVSKTFDTDVDRTWSSSGWSARPTARTCSTSSTPAREGRYAAAAVQRDPQGGRRPRCRATATRCSTTARWWCSGPTSDEPTRVHPMQVWQTPYVSDTYAAAQPAGDRAAGADRQRRPGARHLRLPVGGPHGRRDDARRPPIVRGADRRLRAGLRPATTGSASRRWATCGHRWPRCAATAEQVLDEFEKVQQLTAPGRRRAGRGRGADRRAGAPGRAVRRPRRRRLGRALAELRQAQGHLVTLRELRYVDLARIDELAAALDRRGRTAAAQRARRRSCDGDDAFAGYHAEVERLAAEAGAIADRGRGRTGRRAAGRAGRAGWRSVTEVVGALDIADATVRTAHPGAASPRCSAASTGRGPSWTAAAGSCSARGPGRVRGRVRAARPGDHRRAGRRRHAGALRRAARPADAPAGGPGVALRRVRRLPRRARRQARGGLRGVLRPQAGAAGRARRAGPTGWSPPPSASCQRRPAASPRSGSLDEVNTYFASDPMVAKLRARRRRAARPRRPGPRPRSSTAGQGGPPGGRARPARPAGPVRRRRRDASGSAGTASPSTPSRST